MITDPISTTEPPSIFVQLTVVSATLLLVALTWAQFDPRLIDGIPVWMKPAKFSLSFILHFGTLALVVAAISPAKRTSILIAGAGGVMAVAYLVEMTYMFFQASLAEHSHFNFSTPFHETMYSVMGVGAVLLIAMPVLVAWVARGDTSIGPATRTGIWWGAVCCFVLTLIVAGYLGNNGGHFVGIQTDPARVVPILGWSTEVGDLRPAHFLAIHVLQVLPLVGVWADKTGRSAWIILPVATAYSALTFAAFGQALAGLPLISI